MAFSILLLTLFLPLLASSQSYPLNTTTVGQGYPSNDYALLYYQSLRNTTTLNSVNFQGFNLTIPITNSSNSDQTTNSTEIWGLILGYKRVDVPSPPESTQSGGSQTVITGNTIFSLALQEHQWPINDTDWQLCATVLDSDFSAAISSKKGNSSSGDCEQYLGASCVTAWQHAWQNNFPTNENQGCPSPPLLKDIKECAGLFDGSNGQSMETGLISNITDPGIIYYSSNNSYLDVSSDDLYSASTVPRDGLTWGQWFASRLEVFSQTGNGTTASIAEGRQLRMIGLSIVPSEGFKADYPLYGYVPNTRMICGRADTSAATSLKDIPSVTVLMAFLATIVALW